MAVSTVPVEILTHIFRFLSVSDRKASSLVSRKWYEASLDPMLTKDVLFTFGRATNLTDTVSLLQHRTVTDLILKNLDSSLGAKSTFIAACQDSLMLERLESLCLKNCDVTESIFVAMISNCHSLRSLDISSCNSLFMSGQLLAKPDDCTRLNRVLCNVKDLKLATNRYLSDQTFDRIMSVFANVERLSLAGNKIIFISTIYYGSVCNKTGEYRANSAVLSFVNIQRFLQTRSRSITSLDLGRTAITNEALSVLAKFDGLRLKELYLPHCDLISDSGIIDVAGNQTTLKIFDISECLSVTDKGLAAIAKHLVDLTHLVVSKCRQLSDLSVCQLRKLERLESLDLDACYTITSLGLGVGICSGTMKHLTRLILNCCSSVRDAFVVEASQRLPQLTELDLSSCGITNRSVFAISKYLVRLKTLRLAWCQAITDNGLLGVLDPHEVHVDSETGMCQCTRKYVSNIFNAPKIRACSDHDDHAPNISEAPGFDLVPISNLKDLRLLDLSSCYKLTDASVAVAIKFAALKSLFISLCPGLTDMSLFAIGDSMRSLEELHLAQCIKVSDAGIIYVTLHLKRLTFLNISSCDQLTNRTIEALFVNTQFLRHLDVSLCSRISAEAVDMLETHLRNLTSVQKRHVGTRAYS